MGSDSWWKLLFMVIWNSFLPRWNLVWRESKHTDQRPGKCIPQVPKGWQRQLCLWRGLPDWASERPEINNRRLYAPPMLSPEMVVLAPVPAHLRPSSLFTINHRHSGWLWSSVTSIFHHHKWTEPRLTLTTFEVSHFPVGSSVGVGSMMHELLRLWEDDSDFLPGSTKGKCKSSKKGFLVWSFEMLVISAACRTHIYEPKDSKHSVEYEAIAPTPGLAIWHWHEVTNIWFPSKQGWWYFINLRELGT